MSHLSTKKPRSRNRCARMSTVLPQPRLTLEGWSRGRTSKSGGVEQTAMVRSKLFSGVCEDASIRRKQTDTDKNQHERTKTKQNKNSIPPVSSKPHAGLNRGPPAHTLNKTNSLLPLPGLPRHLPSTNYHLSFLHQEYHIRCHALPLYVWSSVDRHDARVGSWAVHLHVGAVDCREQIALPVPRSERYHL